MISPESTEFIAPHDQVSYRKALISGAFTSLDAEPCSRANLVRI